MIKDLHDFFVPEITAYLNSFPVRENELQCSMREKSVQDGLERWIIPEEVGRFLYLITKIKNPETVYEIGSYLGYSATWFASAMNGNGRVILTEINEQRYLEAESLLKTSPISHQVELRLCDAHKDLENTNEFHDIIFIDHDKPNYPASYHIAKKHLKQNGLIIADDVLWRKRIVSEEWQDDPSTLGIIEFNNAIMNDPEVDSLIVPIGDGISLTTLKN